MCVWVYGGLLIPVFTDFAILRTCRDYHSPPGEIIGRGGFRILPPPPTPPVCFIGPIYLLILPYWRTWRFRNSTSWVGVGQAGFLTIYLFCDPTGFAGLTNPHLQLPNYIVLLDFTSPPPGPIFAAGGFYILTTPDIN